MGDVVIDTRFSEGRKLVADLLEETGVENPELVAIEKRRYEKRPGVLIGGAGL